MIDTEYVDELGLLALCALMPHFTQAQLRVISGATEERVDALLAQDDVLPTDRAGSFQLRVERIDDVLARLRAERPGAEIALHTRAFRYFVACLASQVDEQQHDDADSCFHHLDALFFLLTAQMDWQLLQEHLHTVRAIAPHQTRHLQRLLYYEGYVAIRTQDYARGEPILTQLIAEPVVEPDLRLRAMRGLAHAYWFRTLYDRAIDLHQQIAAYACELGNQSYRGLALLDLAMNYHEIARYNDALAACLEALAIFELRNEPHRTANALYHAGLYAMYLGRWGEADTYCERAGQLLETIGMESALGFVGWLQGYLAHIRGDEAASEAAYQRALAIAELPNRDQPALAMDLHLYLGFLYHTQGSWEQALAHYDQASAIAEQIDRRHYVCLVAFRRGQTLYRMRRHEEARAAYQQAITTIEALKGEFAREDVKISLLGTVQQIYEAMVLLCLELGDMAHAFHYMERARSRAFLDSLAQRSPALSPILEQPVVTLTDVQQTLPRGEVLFEYFTTGVIPRGDHFINLIPPTNTRLRAHLVQPAHIILFAIRRDRSAVFRPTLDPNRLRPLPDDSYPGRHLLHGRIPQALYEQLIAPAAHLLEGSHVLYLIPHGPLHYTPFSALRTRSGDYFVQRHGPALAQAPSATILLRICLKRPKVHRPRILAIGYDDPHGRQPLRYAEVEANHIALMCGGNAWIGDEPKSDHLAAHAQQIGRLHIAGHARFDPSDPLNSALLLGAGDVLSARAIMEGLSLNVDLVTLSSCTSGVSHVVPGDELLGLQRALLYAGAPTVVCTRWEARDLAALLFMDRFYRELRRYRPAAALRNTQVAMREMTLGTIRRIIARWRAERQPPAQLFDDADEVVREAHSVVRALDHTDLAELLVGWREEAEPPDALAEAAIQLSASSDTHPLAEPHLWAPFMLVGRA